MFSKYYQEYITSQEWREKANKRKAIDGYKCAACGNTKNLDVHHLNYRNLGNEDISADLITVCRTCHSRLHYDKDATVFALMFGALTIKAIEEGKVSKTFTKYMRVLFIPIPTGGCATVPIMAPEATGGYTDYETLKFEANRIGVTIDDWDGLRIGALQIYNWAIEDNGWIGNVGDMFSEKEQH